MSDEFKTALKEAIKEPLRLLVLAVIPVLITYFGMFDYPWAIVATLILRTLDSFMHEAAKQEPKAIRNEGIGGVKGLTNF